MTISPLPWFVRALSSDGKGATVHDSTGMIIATFTSYTNAEYFLHSINDYMRLHDKCEVMEDELKTLRSKIELLEDSK